MKEDLLFNIEFDTAVFRKFNEYIFKFQGQNHIFCCRINSKDPESINFQVVHPQQNKNQTCATIESDAKLFVQIYPQEEKF